MNRAYFTAAPDGGYACSQPLDALDGAGNKQTLVDPAAMGLSQVRGVAADGYGDLYILGNPQCASAYPWWAGTTIKRVQLNQMSDPHYYDTFTCCPTNVTMKAMVQRDRGESVRLSCSTALVIIAQGDQSTTVTRSGQSIKLPLGATPTLTLMSGGKALQATWTMQNSARDNSADPDDLFPNDIALLFQPSGESSPAGLAILHVGHFQITATSSQGTFSFTVQTCETTSLGTTHTDLDPTIYTNAERFGVPPQYIKAMIDHESSFNAADYRYEPRTWDYGASQIGFRQRLADPAFSPFAFKEPAVAGAPGSPVAEGALASTWKDMRLDSPLGFRLLHSFSAWQQGQGCTAVSAADDDLLAYSLSLGSSAWYGPIPSGSPYHSGPCGVGEDWYQPVSVWAYDEYRAGQGCPVSSVSLDFFYNNSYNAQTVLAASYGYMQLGFETLKKLGWLNGPAPNPHTLETADVNIGLGSRWLAQKRKRVPSYYDGNVQASLSDLQSYFIWLCTLYNGSQDWSGPAYGKKIVNQYAPAYQPTIPAQ